MHSKLLRVGLIVIFKRTRLDQEQRREIQQPPKGKIINDLRKEHEVERRELEENSLQERQIFQRQQKRERNAVGTR